MKKIFYWSPCLSKVGTTNSTINSAIGMSKFFKNEFKVYLINSCGEWDKHIQYLQTNNVEVIKLNYSFFNYLPKKGFIGSRISYVIIFLFSFIPLLNLLKKEKPDFIILHLITSLPLLLLSIFKFKTKFILRISGYPNLNLIRKFFWKKISKKIYKITFPTKDLINQIKNLNIFDELKISYLPDAVVNIKDFLKSTFFNNSNYEIKNYFLSAGRLTKQKNFEYLINEFGNFCSNNKNYKLLIFGEGEDKLKLEKQIKKNKLENKIILMGFSENLFNYMRKAEAFILSSLWEEPGFVIVEAAMCNLFVISSDCKNGPSEFLQNGRSGFLYKSNIKHALKDKLEEFSEFKNNLKEKRINAKKNCLKYTMFRHSLELKKILV